MQGGFSKKRSVLEFMLSLLIFSLIFTAMAYLIITASDRYFSSLFQATGEVSAGVQGKLIIDPGHGGEDGGSSSGDVVEKDLNLQVSENLYCFCKFAGIPAEMTRREDTLLYDLYGDLDNYKGKKKVYDLKNRLRFAKEEGGTCYVGIHMNKFPESKYSGLQVYYSPNNRSSERLAKTIQSYTKEHLQPTNERQVKKASSSIFILSEIEIPAVLVECGFLSNPKELEMLQSVQYRRDLALEMFCAVGEYTASEK